MRIDFQKIEIHNFMSFSDVVFDYTQQNGMSLITGKNFDIPTSKNGTGKSCLWAALIYGLYGQLSNKVKTEHIANRNLSDKEVRIVVWLNVDDIRYKTITSLNKRAQSSFLLFRIEDGEDVDLTKSTILETREFFESEIMHCDISLFLRTILLTSEQNYNFFNLKKQDKRDFIEKLFDIGVFSDMYDNIHKDLLVSDRLISLLQNSLLQLKNSEQQYSSLIDDFDKKKSIDIENLTTLLDESTKVLNDIQKAYDSEKNLIDIKYQQAKEKLEVARKNILQKVFDTKISLQQSVALIKSAKQIQDDKRRIISNHSVLLDRLCDDCKPIFAEYHNLNVYQKEIDELAKIISSLSSIVLNQKKEIADFEAKLTAVDDKKKLIDLKISAYEESKRMIERKRNQALRDLDLITSLLNNTKAKENPYTKLLEETKEAISSKTKTINEEQVRYRYLKKAEEIVNQDSIKKFVIKDLISLINNRIRHYLIKMGAKYTCIFDEDLDYLFITDSGECELQNFSCGEKKRIEIATCLSFRDFIALRSNLSSNILVVDEYIDSGIDALAVESILGILKEFTKTNNQNIFIISHRAEVSNDTFDRIIELQKKNGISYILYI